MIKYLKNDRNEPIPLRKEPIPPGNKLIPPRNEPIPAKNPPENSNSSSISEPTGILAQFVS